MGKYKKPKTKVSVVEPYSEVVPCDSCNKKTKEDLKDCVGCNKSFCDDCCFKDCKFNDCEKHCCFICYDDCPLCNEKCCMSCRIDCDSCENSPCSSCYKVCEKCNNEVCEMCYNEVENGDILCLECQGRI